MKHIRVYLPLALCGLLAVPSVAAAQGHSRERRQDRKEARQDRREARDDLLDAARLQALRRDFDAARARRNRRALDGIDARLQRMLREEARETRREVRDDKREARKGKGNRDLRKEQAARARLQEIRRALIPLYGKYDPRSLSKKRALITDLIQLARREIRQDRKETRDDRKDRKDRRDDRRPPR